MTVQYEVILDSLGGANVITCNAFSFRNFELVGDVTPENIRKEICKKMVIDLEDSKADFVLKIIDNRPEEENYNDVKARESKEHKPKTTGL